MKKQDFNCLNRIIIGPGYPLRGGISESNESLCKSFNQEEKTCQIISYSLQYPSILFPGKKQTVGLSESSTHTNLNLINTLNPLSWFNTVRKVLKIKPHYVIIRYWHPYFAICLALIARLLRHKSIFIIAWVDNIYPHDPMPFQNILTNFFLKSCDTYMVMSKSVKKDLLNFRDLSSKKVKFSPHPIYSVFGNTVAKKIAQKNIGLTKDNTQVNNKYILFFGLIRKYKGLELLLEVMALEKIKKLNIYLIIAGEFYEKKSKYLEKIKFLGIENKIILHDNYIPNEDVKNYFCAADIVVQPYLSATQSGVSMVALNFNKPVLLTNVGGLSEYVTHNFDGYLVDPDKEKIASALEDYFANNREGCFSKNIEIKKTEFSWKGLANKFDNLYSNFQND
ncbi:MAG: glycosyl transferase family 1 [Flavobacteriales bacterium]|nr:glycosyl transferase family 1 [Flavobacteriales bacterium]